MSTRPANLKTYSESGNAPNADRSVSPWAEKQGYTVTFTHEPTGHSVEFPAVISDFSDTHDPAYTQTHGASMHDPIITMTKTTRNISFQLTVLNSSLEEARYNTQCVNLLIQMLYPTLDHDGTFIDKPFINIHLMNLLEGSVSNTGVTCVVKGINYKVNFDKGVITAGEGIESLNRSEKEVYPVSISMSISAEAVIPSTSDSSTTVDPVPRNYPSYGKWR